MKKLFDFRCSEGHVTEEYVDAETRTVRCKCGQEAHRIISPVPFKLNGADASWPTAHSKWIKEHEEAGRKNPAP